jgi:hypothetical protein
MQRRGQPINRLSSASYAPPRRLRIRRRHSPVGRLLFLFAVSMAVAVQVVSARQEVFTATDTVVINVLALGAAEAPTAAPTAAALPDTFTSSGADRGTLLLAGLVLLAIPAASSVAFALRRILHVSRC